MMLVKKFTRNTDIIITICGSVISE